MHAPLPAVVVIVLLLAACGDDAEPPREAPAPRSAASWIHLSEGVRGESEDPYWQRHELARSDFKKARGDKLWSALLPRHPDAHPESVPRLVSGAHEFAWHGPADGPRPQANAFTVLHGRVLLRLPDDGPPPESSTLWVPLEGGVVRGERWRIALGQWACDGFFVAADRAVTCDVDIPPDGSLRFGVVPFSSPVDGPGRLRILAGSRVLSHIEWKGSTDDATWHDIPIDHEDEGFLRFEAEGAFAGCAVVAPVLGPRELGTPTQRPWGPSPDDAVIFLADTLRADSLGCYDASWGVSPHIDRFAATAERYAHAWAPSTWTLPSQASLLHGVYPHQHGATKPGLPPARGLISLAERLQQEGWRTAAITDSLFVSRRHELDRGFEWFREHDHADLAATARAIDDFYAADDGRPTFLYVQTYRVHAPYEVSERTREEHGARIGLRYSWTDVRRMIQPGMLQLLETHDLLDQVGEGGELSILQRIMTLPNWRDELQAIADDAGFEAPLPDVDVIDALYRAYVGSTADLDRGFQALLDRLDEAGRRDRTHVVFTSDHGESFGEHDLLLHGYGLFEEALRIPMLVRSPGRPPTVDAAPASLVDLPRTLTSRLGVEPNPQWRGRPLGAGEAPPTSRPADVAFATTSALEGASYAVVFQPPYKVAAPLESSNTLGDVSHVFDLVADPEERNNQVASPPRRAAGLLAQHRARLEAWLLPMGQSTRRVLDAAERARLEAAGYLIPEGEETSSPLDDARDDTDEESSQ